MFTNSFWILTSSYGNIHKAREEKRRLKGGETGKSNSNAKNIETPRETQMLKPIFLVNNYKSFVREQLFNHIREHDLKAFYYDIEGDENIRTLYDTFALMHDLQNLEKQYFPLRTKIDFVPFFELLRKRAEEYAKHFPEPADNLIALRILLTAISSKLASIKTNENKVSVIDLEGYLDMIKDNINSLMGTEKALHIDKLHREYKESMDNKVQQANDLIQKQIIPAIKDALQQVNLRTHELLDEIKCISDELAEEKAYLEAYREELEQALNIHGAMFAIQLTTIVVSAAFDFVTLDKAVFSSGSGRPKLSSLNTKYNQEALNVLYEQVAKMNATLIDLKESMAREHHLLHEQLCDVGKLLENITVQGIDEVKQETEEAKQIITERLKSGKILDPREASTMRDHLRDVVDALFYPDVTGYFPVAGALLIARGLLEISHASLAFYLQVKEDERKITEVSRAIAEVEKKIKHWIDMCNKIYDLALPLFWEIIASFKQLLESIESQTPIELDVTQWRILSTLKDLKAILRETAEGTTMQEPVSRSVERVEAAIAILINLQQRAESYEEKAKFADYLAGLQSGVPELNDPDLNSAVLNLRQIIQSNRVLEQFEVGMQAFKQHEFPFAQSSWTMFELPSTLDSNDTVALIRRAAEQILQLRNQILISRLTVGKYDRDIFTDVELKTNADNKLSDIASFYQWNYEKVADDIEKYLRGEVITLNADIRKGLQHNAVKLNRINFRIRVDDVELQSQLDDYINRGSTVLEAIGNSYYRCGDKFYYISMDDNIVFEYTNQKRPNSDIPLRYNEVYRKISQQGSYVISPYAMWKIQLKLDPYANSSQVDALLSKLRTSSVTIELVGRGKYFKNDLLAYEVCNENLQKYYHLDTTTSPLYPLEGLKLRYSLL